jgi:hypothetical protein
MKRGGYIFVCLILLFFLALPFCVSAENGATVVLESRVIESFDPETKASDWVVVGSKFSAEEYPKMVSAKSWPEALFGANREGKDLQVLGVNGSFVRQGYNSIEIIPVKKESDGAWEPTPIPMPGKVKTIDLWVWGSNYDYYMDAHVSDFEGVVHVLRLGSLKYIGWKNLKADIPSYIPQTIQYIPHHKGLELVKLVLWTKPAENVKDFYLYIDQVKVLTDVFVNRFDGDDMTQPEFMQEVWSAAKK